METSPRHVPCLERISSYWRTSSRFIIQHVRRTEAPNFEPAQCFQHATSHQRNSSETGRTAPGKTRKLLNNMNYRESAPNRCRTHNPKLRLWPDSESVYELRTSAGFS